MFNLKAAPIITNAPVALFVFGDFNFSSIGNHLFVERIGNDFSKRMFDFPIFEDFFDVKVK